MVLKNCIRNMTSWAVDSCPSSAWQLFQMFKPSTAIFHRIRMSGIRSRRQWSFITRQRGVNDVWQCKSISYNRSYLPSNPLSSHMTKPFVPQLYDEGCPSSTKCRSFSMFFRQTRGDAFRFLCSTCDEFSVVNIQTI